MKYCNDKEKATIIFAAISCAIVAFIVQQKIFDVGEYFMQDIITKAKLRFLMKQCDECAEKQSKQQVDKEDGND